MESGKLEELTAVNDKIGVSEYALEMLDEYVYFFRKNFDDDIAKYNRDILLLVLIQQTELLQWLQKKYLKH